MILSRLEASEGLAKSQVANDIKGRVVVPSYSVNGFLATSTPVMQLPDEKVYVVDNYRLLLSHYTHASVYCQKEEERGERCYSPSSKPQSHPHKGDHPFLSTITRGITGRNSTYYSDR